MLYWLSFWVNCAGLYNNQVIEIAEKKLETRIYSSNQGLEGAFNQEKNLTSTVKEDMNTLPCVIKKRWDDNVRSSRLLARQIVTARSVLRKRMKKALTKITGQIKEEAEESEMMWIKTAKTIKAINYDIVGKLKKAFRYAGRDGLVFSWSNHGMFCVLDDHATKNDTAFMSHATFHKFMNGDRRLLLRDENIDVIDSFCKKYLG